MLSTVITAFSIALASGLLMSVWVVKEQSERNFMGVDSGFDAVVGAPGSKLQLVLNSIFHLESSDRNLTWEQYESVASHPMVRTAIPLAVGDNHQGYRLVGVTTNLFEVEFREGEKYAVQDGGYIFRPDKKQAVVGSFVAERLRLKVGDKFHPYHGLTFDETAKHDEVYVVTGIMKPTNTPGDRVIWIPIKGLQNMSGHEADKSAEVSAVLVKLISATQTPLMDKQINSQGKVMTFAGPIAMIVAQLFNKIAPVEMVLRCIAVLVALVAAGSILSSIYNSMNERRREIAILRALGARRRTVFGVVILESSSIAALGALVGFVVYFIIMFVATWYIRAETGIALNPLEPQWVMLWAPLAMLALGALAGIVPASKAYSTNVATNLIPFS